jgi:hypothetical protein
MLPTHFNDWREIVHLILGGREIREMKEKGEKSN